MTHARKVKNKCKHGLWHRVESGWDYVYECYGCGKRRLTILEVGKGDK